MRILLDACVPRKLKLSLPGHSVKTAREAGLNRLSDGVMLDAAHGKFDIIVTVDKSLRFQQRMMGRTFSLIVLRTRSNRIKDLSRLIPQLLAAARTVKPGEVREVGPL